MGNIDKSLKNNDAGKAHSAYSNNVNNNSGKSGSNIYEKRNIASNNQNSKRYTDGYPNAFANGKAKNATPNAPKKKSAPNNARKKELYTRYFVNGLICVSFFAAIIICGGIVSVHMLNKNKPTYSEFEKRNLEPAPEFSVSSIANGSYTENFDKFFSDNFPMREKFVAYATNLKRFRGIRAFNSDAKQVIDGDSDMYSSGNMEIEVDENKFKNAEDIIIQGLPNQNGEDSTQPEQSSDTPQIPNVPQDNTPQQPIIPNGENETQQNQQTVVPPPEETGVSQPEENNNKPQTNSNEQTTQNNGALRGEKRDSIYIIGDTAYEYFRGSAKSSSDYINVINTYAKYIPAGINIYTMIIPTHTEFGLEGVDRQVSNEQKPVIEHIGKNLDGRIIYVNPYDKLYAHYQNGEYLYFRTDHHWTIRGAYYAYCEFCEKAGITPIPQESYEVGKIEPFLGTFYSTSRQDSSLGKNPDYVEYFKIPTACTVTRYDTKGNMTKGALYYTKVGGEANSYLAFMGGDFAYINIRTENQNGKKLMIFKESFANPLIGLLAQHYEEIHVADIRYFPYNAVNFINQYGITDVLFCNGIMSANTSARVNDLMKLINK